jgi:hypothetical protein
VHVLQHAVGVARNLDPEVLVHPAVPLGREVTRLDVAGEQVLLELEPENDVHVVGDLVGGDPDQRRLHDVDRAEPRLLVDVVQHR